MGLNGDAVGQEIEVLLAQLVGVCGERRGQQVVSARSICACLFPYNQLNFLGETL